MCQQWKAVPQNGLGIFCFCFTKMYALKSPSFCVHLQHRRSRLQCSRQQLIVGLQSKTQIMNEHFARWSLAYQDPFTLITLWGPAEDNFVFFWKCRQKVFFRTKMFRDVIIYLEKSEKREKRKSWWVQERYEYIKICIWRVYFLSLYGGAGQISYEFPNPSSLA